MAQLLKCFKYEQHKRKICADLKVVGILLGLQGGYTRYCCFLCMWDSRARGQHYVKKKWGERVNFKQGEANIKYAPLVAKDDIILPPLHIKLGLIKNLVKALDKTGDAFIYLRTIFPKLSHAKIKEGVFDGPQIKKLLESEQFELHLSRNEAAAFNSFRLVVAGFLGNNKSPDFVKIINDLLKNYKKIGM